MGLILRLPVLSILIIALVACKSLPSTPIELLSEPTLTGTSQLINTATSGHKVITSTGPFPEPTITESPQPTTIPTAGNAMITSTGNAPPVVDVYSLKVISVEKLNYIVISNVLRGAIPGHSLIEIEITLYKNGELFFDDYELMEVALVDSEGGVYYGISIKHVGSVGADNVFIWDHDAIVFQVPDTATGLKLRYKALPLVDIRL